MIRTNVPASRLETSSTEQTITHVNSLPIDPVYFKDVTVLELGTVLVFPTNGSTVLSLKDSDRVHVRS